MHWCGKHGGVPLPPPRVGRGAEPGATSWSWSPCPPRPRFDAPGEEQAHGTRAGAPSRASLSRHRSPRHSAALEHSEEGTGGRDPPEGTTRPGGPGRGQPGWWGPVGLGDRAGAAEEPGQRRRGHNGTAAGAGGDGSPGVSLQGPRVALGLRGVTGPVPREGERWHRVLIQRTGRNSQPSASARAQHGEPGSSCPCHNHSVSLPP